jgi:putative transposase
VAATETALAELMAADLSGLDLVALMVDGVNFAGHCLVVAVGIDPDGVKRPLGVVEGDTENARLVTDLLVGLRERGLCVTTPILCVLDGANALASALKAVFDHPVIARCQLHKIRNVRRHLPDKVAGGEVHAGRLPQPRPLRRPGRSRGVGQGTGPRSPRRGGQPAGGTGVDLHRGT